MRTIAMLTSGGDSPGMNPAIRAIVLTAIYNSVRVMGIRYGYDGLIKGDIYEMNVSSVADIIQKGGTILGSARSQEFMTQEGQDKAVQVLKEFGVDSLIIMGGDGSFRGGKVILDRGIKTIGLPCTIDNDMGYTDYTIGFFTAVETAMDAIGKLRDTSSSHGRANIVEVMGRNSGNIALYASLAGGAESIIIPEMPFDSNESIINNINRGKKRGKFHHIIVVAEGAYSKSSMTNAYDLARDIQEKTGVITKVTVLGHIQRGGTPSAFDRLLATQMGNEAVRLLLKGEEGLAIAIKDNRIVSKPFLEAVEMSCPINQKLIRIAKELAI